MPDLSLTHLLKMTDNVGLLQHATFDAPYPDFGYCTDDNARGLMFAVQALEQSPSDRRLETLIGQYFRFLQTAFMPESGTFRNLLGYDGKWADEAGPGDSQGRALWALGVLVGESADRLQRTDARMMFERALPASEAWQDLRPIANTIIGACAFLLGQPSPQVRRTLQVLVERLTFKLDQWQKPDWPWFEPMMTYENARIPHALIAAGETLENERVVARGLASLEWLMDVQTNDGQFSPVGNDGWYARGGLPARFDQQPIEAEASLTACAAAFDISGDDKWLKHAQRSFEWFRGVNAAGQPLGNDRTGGCCDGLGRDGVNQNQGAESTLAWLSSQLSMATLAPDLLQIASKEVSR